MNQSLTKRQSPEELELDAKRAELAGLAEDLADKELQFEELNTENVKALPKIVLLESMATLIDSSHDKQDMAGIRKGIKIGELILSRADLDELELAKVHYYLGNAWGEVVQASEPTNHWNWQGNDVERELFHFRSSIASNGFEQFEPTLQAANLCNMSNALDFMGRSFESLEPLRRGYSLIPIYGMVSGLLGSHLLLMAKKFPVSYYKYVYFTFSHEFLSKAISKPKGIHPNDLPTFKESLLEIEQKFDINKLYAARDQLLEKESHEYVSEYQIWCLRQNLCLCPLNDLQIFNKHFCDCFASKNNLKVDFKLDWLPTFFEQICMEYQFARHLVFVGSTSLNDASSVNVVNKVFCFADAGENLKTSFRLLYSLFDKIAYFINANLDLRISIEKVNMKSVWFKNVEKRELRDLFIGKENLPLMGLFRLTLDIYSKDNSFQEVLDPDTRRLAELRNALEHRAIRLTVSEDASGQSGSQANGKEDLCEFVVTYDELLAKTLKLAFLVRCAIMYLNLAVHAEHNEAQ